MDVWSPSAVPVGILWWNGPSRRLTIIAKMTLKPQGAAFVLADEQEPLSATVPSGYGVAEELRYPSDFVPFKPRCDVLLVGSAYASTAQAIIPFYFRVGTLERRVYALAGQPSNSIPLSSMYLRREANSGAEEVAVGPLSVQHAHRACYVDPRIPTRGAAFEQTTLPRDFDGRCFNAAPWEQQIDPITPGTALVVPWHGAEPQNMWIPPIRPRIFTFDQTTESGLREVPMTCDTLWIDTDRARCVLTFRGVIDPVMGGPFPTAVVAVFASVYDAVLAGAAKMICAQAAVRKANEPRAVEGPVAESIVPPHATNTPSVARSPSYHDDAGTNIYTNLTARTSAVPFVSPSQPPARQAATTPSAARSPSYHDDEGTNIYTNLTATASAVPFVSPSQPPARQAATVLPNLASRAPVLPFGGGAGALAAMPESRLVPVDRRAESMHPSASALPFVQAHRPSEAPISAQAAPTRRKPDTIIPTASASALPFVSTSRPLDARPDTRNAAASSGLPLESSPRSALPFVSNEPRKRPSTLPPMASFVTTEYDRPSAPPPQPMPFVTTEYDRPSAPPPQPMPSAPNDVPQVPLGRFDAQSLAASSFPVLRSAAPPSTPEPAAALDTSALMRLSLDTFAEIKVDLWSGIGLRETLARHGIDQRSYHLYERRQADELGDEVRLGALDRTRALRAALRRARERRGPVSADDVIL